MLRNVGIIGYGFVGRSVGKIFENNSELIIVDPQINTSFTYTDFSSKNVPVTFVCVPAPTLEDGSVDISVICTVLDELVAVAYRGIVVIKSTVPPKMVHYIYEKYAQDTPMMKDGPLRLVYSPEFLRERHWDIDAQHPNLVIFGGDWHTCSELRMIYENHATIKSHPRYFITSVDEASLIKYTINCFLALKVTFFNQVYNYYKDEINDGREPHYEIWKEFVSTISADFRLGNSHMTVPGPDGQKGYGGSCFPKDMKAFIGSDSKNHLSILREAELANTKIRLTGNDESSNNN